MVPEKVPHSQLFLMDGENRRWSLPSPSSAETMGQHPSELRRHLKCLLNAFAKSCHNGEDCHLQMWQMVTPQVYSLSPTAAQLGGESV